VDESLGEVGVAPAKGAQLAHAQTGVGRREVEHRVLGRGGRASERPHLLGREHVELPRAADRLPVDARCRVGREPVDALRALEDPVHEREVLVDRAGRELILDDQPAAERVDVGAGDRLDRRLPEHRSQHALDHQAVVAQG